LGILLSILIIFLLSNTTLKIRVIGCDESLYVDVISVLKLNGVEAGKFIPNMDFDRIEKNIVTTLNDVSWVAIRSSGGIITVDVAQTTPKPDMVPQRLPCNIISTKNAQIKGIEVYAGQLMVVMDNAVKKGDLLVSGFVVDKTNKATYYHAQAKIIGEYLEAVEFSQPLNENVKITSEKSQKRNYFNFFSLKIPLYIGKKINGEYAYNDRTNYFSLFTLKLPLGISHCSYQPFVTKNFNYSLEQATELLDDKMKTYEDNFFKNCKIINREIIKSNTDISANYIVKYTLQGDITQNNEILTK